MMDTCSHMQRFPFNPIKAIQAVAHLLSQHPNFEMSYIRMLKLLYIADRECLAETGRPITGGGQVVMDHGPLHSRIYNMVLGSDIRSRDWQKYIKKEGYQIKLVEDPGMGSLTKFEGRKLTEVIDRFKDMDDWALVRHTHTFEEVKKNEPPRGSSNILPLDDVLDAIGMSDKAQQIKQDMCDSEAINKAIRG